MIPWGDSSKLKVAEWVMAVGNPFSLNQTVTLGIVSALGRANVGITAYEDFIQTDAAINRGNSGGALVNARGELIGINTGIFSSNQNGGSEGIGFAIPSNLARSVIGEIIEHGVVRRGSLGRIALETVYVSFDRPRVAAVKMVNTPPFFATWAASIPVCSAFRRPLATAPTCWRWSYSAGGC